MDAVADIIFLHRHGNHGILDGASKGQLEGEFGTSKDDDVFKQIIENGSIVESEVRFISLTFLNRV